MRAIVTNSAGLLYLAENARGRNRSVHEDRLAQGIDPDGTHVLVMQFPHNDVEMRTQWVCKMKGTLRPAEIWLDVDFDALEECTTEIEGVDDDE